MKNALLFFVKYPTPGKVKTRLARTVGNDEAARIYRQLAQINYAVLRSVQDVDLIVMFDPPEDKLAIKEWLAEASHYFPQNGNDLGQRLNESFETAFQNGYLKVVAVGSDALGLKAQIIEQSFLLLDRFDVVIGPAKDGGYYLIGSSRHASQLFEGISWSTSVVLAETIKKIQGLRWRYAFLDQLEDLDEIQNLPSNLVEEK